MRYKKIDGITGIADHSNREGMRICIELRRDANANVILNQLYKHTQMQDTFGVIMLALVNNQPKVMNLLEMLTYYLQHQEEVVTRRTKYDLNKAQERSHILEGLLKALDHIDEVIHIIRASANAAEAKKNLMERFDLSDAQAQAIVDMRLRALTGLEREKLENEYKELMARIEQLKAILADRKVLLGVIRREILTVSEKYGDDRRTSIGFDEYDLSMEDLIPRENTVITMTKLGYIKRMTVENGTLDAVQLGIIGSALLFSYALGKFVNGFLADHSNIKRFMATGLAVSAVANFCVGACGLLQGNVAFYSNMLLFVVFAAMWGINGWAQSMGASTVCLRT